MPLPILGPALLAAAVLAAAPAADLPRLRAQAARVSIARDSWGVAHVHGRSDADAVFGMAYAQAEDDFHRVEVNYLTALGRMAEAEGEARLWQDLRQRLYVDPEDLKAKYAASPAWLRAIMDGWAGGLNLYLATHRDVKPMVLNRFEPWMALSFTEGSIGGDIERIDLKALQAFYDGPQPRAVARAEPSLAWREPSGSNGIAIAPKNTKDGHALLLINPHTSFYFRSELQVTSDAGLNAYGAATWGQPFIYQGWNPHVGWMHTSSGVDAVDEFRIEPGGSLAICGDRPGCDLHGDGRETYGFGRETRPILRSPVILKWRTGSGALASRTFITLHTHRGPVVRKEGERWIAFAMMYRPVEALEQSFLRTKSGSVAAFRAVSDRYKANSSNNTLLADAAGHIAYLHPQFIPKRDSRFDYAKPVDGSDPAADWAGDTPAADTPHAVDPPSGYVYNSNDAPWNVAGRGTLKASAYPAYMDQNGSNARTEHALEVLDGRRGFTLESLRAAAYDSHLPAFEHLISPLVRAWEALPAADPLRARLAAPVATLRGWDRRWAADSVATSVAVFWGERLWALAAPAARAAKLPPLDWMAAGAGDAQRLEALDSAVAKLAADFGRWDTPWGEINRFQRLDDSIAPRFDDARPSIPVPFASAQWGSLASFGAKAYPNTKRWYGSSGNSFVAAVEFGPRVRALAVTAGGESGDPASPHFADQSARYAAGDLREVWFHPDQVRVHTVRTYRPGS